MTISAAIRVSGRMPTRITSRELVICATAIMPATAAKASGKSGPSAKSSS